MTMNIPPAFDWKYQLLNNYILSVERRASSVERRASSVERRASSVERRASSVERRASSVERRASSVERRASSVDGYPESSLCMDVSYHESMTIDSLCV